MLFGIISQLLVLNPKPKTENRKSRKIEFRTEGLRDLPRGLGRAPTRGDQLNDFQLLLLRNFKPQNAKFSILDGLNPN